MACTSSHDSTRCLVWASHPLYRGPLTADHGRPTQQTHQVADPAIASIGNPPLRNGGFGEGFGFGGGIGGRGVGRGPRLGGYASPQGQAHYSTRKTQDSTESRDNTIQGHMGRFMAKNEKRPEVCDETNRQTESRSIVRLL